MNEPPGARARVALSALTVAEYFRDEEKQDVLLFVDNIFRFTQAGSEVSALLGRIPSAVGYQPTLSTEMGGLQERITSTKNGSITSVQAIYVPADDLTDPAPATAFAHLDATTVLNRAITEKGIYPAVDPLDSTSTILTPAVVGDEHYNVAREVQRILQRYKDLAGHHRDPRHGRALRGRQAHGLARAQDRALPVAAVPRRRDVHRPPGHVRSSEDTVAQLRGDPRRQVRRPARAGVLDARHRRRARQGRAAQEGIGLGRADDHMKLSLTTPRGAVVDLDVDEVTAPGALGEFGVLPGHVPLMSALKPGVLVYRERQGRTRASSPSARASCRSRRPSQADTAHDKVLVLVDQALVAADIDKAEAQKDLAAADKELAAWKARARRRVQGPRRSAPVGPGPPRRRRARRRRTESRSGAPTLPDKYRFFVTCPRGTEGALRRELAGMRIGSPKGDQRRRVVRGAARDGDGRVPARAHARCACCCVSRSSTRATRRRSTTARARSTGRAWLTATSTLAVDANVSDNPALTHSGFAALKVKDAVVDSLRDALGARPDVDPKKPDVSIVLHVAGGQGALFLDLAGEPLHRRGYRVAMTDAPLKETLAAAVLMLGGVAADRPFVDPMAGGGTLAIEHALAARGMPPGLRRRFGFERWPAFSATSPRAPPGSARAPRPRPPRWRRARSCRPSCAPTSRPTRSAPRAATPRRPASTTT